MAEADWRQKGAAWADICVSYAFQQRNDREAARWLLGHADSGPRKVLMAQHAEALACVRWGALQVGCAPGLEEEAAGEAVDEMLRGFRARLREVAETEDRQ